MCACLTGRAHESKVPAEWPLMGNCKGSGGHSCTTLDKTRTLWYYFSAK